LYFSDPRNFNDPFDSLPRYNLSNDVDKLKRFYCFISKYLNESLPNLKDQKDFDKKHSEYKHVINTYLHVLNSFESSYSDSKYYLDYRTIEIYTFYNDSKYFDRAYELNSLELQNKMYHDFVFLTIDINKFGISCGSLKSNCPLMWGHYANNHSGLCIKYEISSNLSFENQTEFEIVNVNYSDIPLNIFDYSPEELRNLKYELIRNKYSKWAYEEEIRILHYQGLLKINKSKIREIIFGHKSTPRDRYSVIKLVACLGYSVERLSIAKVLPNIYELSIENMTFGDIADSGVHIEELNLSKAQIDLLK
ncbi:MAG: DUF2971 domain-containing protein, partial [Pedobacter sp.]